MTVPPPATTMAAVDSDSDDQERPQKEPEFIVHVVDDHRPPAPPVQMRRPAPPPMFVLPQEQPRHDYGGDECGRKGCTYCLFVKAILFVVVMSMVVMTVAPATQLPKEYKKGSHVFMILGPIIIGVAAFSWMVLSIVFDNEPC